MAERPKLSPIYVFFGDDDQVKREKISAARKHLVGDGDPGMCLSEYDGDDAGIDLARVLDELRTLPFLAPRRVVVLHKADGFLTKYRSELEKYLEDPSPCGVLVLVPNTFLATTRLYKAIDALGGIRKCEKPKGRSAVLERLHQLASALGKRLEPAAADNLLDAVGEEPALLQAELEKLSTYVGDKPTIVAADVEELTADNRTAAVFELSDALASGKPGRALSVVHSMCTADKRSPYAIVGYLVRHLRRLASARAAMDAGADERGICKAAGYNWVMPPFVGLVRRFDRAGLVRAYRELAEADMTLKSQPDDPRLVIERFVLSAMGVR